VVFAAYCAVFADLGFVSAGKKRGFCRLGRRVAAFADIGGAMRGALVRAGCALLV